MLAMPFTARLRRPLAQLPSHRSFLRRGGVRAMGSHIVGHPRIGPKRELKFALGSFWDGKCSVEELQKVAKDLRVVIWKQMAEAGTKFIPSNTFSYYDQFDEPTLVLDLDSNQLKSFEDAYTQLGEAFSGLNVLVETYFADIPSDAYKVVTGLEGVSAFGFDLVRGQKTLELVENFGFPPNKYLFAGIVDGRNIWANDLSASLRTLKNLEAIVGKENSRGECISKSIGRCKRQDIVL